MHPHIFDLRALLQLHTNKMRALLLLTFISAQKMYLINLKVFVSYLNNLYLPLVHQSHP